MNTCVSDDQHVVNIQGIRFVSWGESASTYGANIGKPWFVQVTYKGNSPIFNYRTEEQARSFFRKIRAAMDKTAEKP